ncbi:DnaJ domain-containing protein [Desulfonatronospira sp. MSAO_Bac3]|uniref:J domain-containing protein n=1 Tax=Desulfonatronospira sp. MSAO_Bac3 TaxID=2293857 RepID=UPI000FED85DD|nr:DnaJ domain-containing protein [Desulfonatronospira sp. MSAO_Bac3]RQD73788.1 MAG: hypothetical protein D5S03_11945 [Desulfonatronospira sp. MSAO_Bac3]
MLEQDHRIIRVDRDADQESIRKSYIKLSRRYHPEHFPEKFRRIKCAYERLSLDPSTLADITRELARAESTDQITSLIIKQAGTEATEKKKKEELVMDPMTLEPVLNVRTVRQKISGLLQDIEKKGIKYKTAEETGRNEGAG